MRGHRIPSKLCNQTDSWPMYRGNPRVGASTYIWQFFVRSDPPLPSRNLTRTTLLAIRRDNGASPAVKGWLVWSAGKDLTKVTKATSSTCRSFPQRPVHPDSCKSLLSFCRWVIFWSLPKEVGWALCYSYFGSWEAISTNSINYLKLYHKS